MSSGDTILRCLQHWATTTPSRRYIVSVDDTGKQSKEYSYSDVYTRVQGIGRGLLKHNVKQDDRVLLVFIPGTLDMSLAFFRLDRDVPVFARAAQDSGAKVVLTNSEYHRAAFRPFTGAKWPSDLLWLKVNDFKKSNKNAGTFPDLPQGQYAFLQYTSGSTANPKGVMISQKALMSDLRGMVVAHDFDEKSIMLSWVPHFHDMGLVGAVLAPVPLGFSAVILSPMLFLSSPATWIQLVSKYRATHAPTPNFGLILAARKSTPKDRVGLDLSVSRFVIGAEPVRFNTVKNFLELFKPHGMKEENIMVAYGMAEHVVSFLPLLDLSPCDNLFFDTGKIASNKFSFESGYLTLDRNAFEQKKVIIVSHDTDRSKCVPIMSCGPPISPEFELIVVDGDTFLPVGEDVIGEVWVSSDAVGSGYWGQEELSQQIFHAKLGNGGTGVSGTGYLRTGDYGFKHNGEVYICGRQKDLIIIGGRNFYPQDIEVVVESADARIRPGCVIAFEVEVGEDQQESLVLFAEIREPKKMKNEEFEELAVIKKYNQSRPTPAPQQPPPQQQQQPSQHAPIPHITEKVADAKVSETHSQVPPRKSSQDNTAHVTVTPTPSKPTNTPPQESETTSSSPSTTSSQITADINSVLSEVFADVLSLEEELADSTDLYSLGVGSLAATQIVLRLNDTFGLDISIADLYSQTTVGDLRLWLNEQVAATGKLQQIEISDVPAVKQDNNNNNNNSNNNNNNNNNNAPTTTVVETVTPSSSSSSTIQGDLDSMVDFYAILNKKKNYVIPSKVSTFGPFVQPNVVLDTGYSSHLQTLAPGQIKELVSRYARAGYFWKVKGTRALSPPTLKITSVGSEKVPHFYAVIAPDIRGGFKFQLPYLRYTVSHDDAEYLINGNPASLQETETDVLRSFCAVVADLRKQGGGDDVIDDRNDVSIVGQTALGQRIVVALNKACLVLKPTDQISQNLGLSHKLAHLAYDEGSRHVKKTRSDDLLDVKHK